MALLDQLTVMALTQAPEQAAINRPVSLLEGAQR